MGVGIQRGGAWGSDPKVNQPTHEDLKLSLWEEHQALRISQFRCRASKTFTDGYQKEIYQPASHYIVKLGHLRPDVNIIALYPVYRQAAEYIRAMK